MTTALQVVNFALDRLGVPVITTLGSDGTKQDDFMNRNYADIWKEVMRSAGVNATRSRVQLKYTSMALTLSSLAVGTGVTATAAAAFFSARDVGAILRETGSGATGVATITAYTSTTIVTVENTVAWTTLTPAANAWLLDPLGNDFAYAYELPSGFLKAIELDDTMYSYDIEGTRILTSAADAVLHFWWYESDPTNWDPALLQAVIAKLAMEAAWPLTEKESVVKIMAAQYADKLKEAMGASKGERQAYSRVLATDLSDVR